MSAAHPKSFTFTGWHMAGVVGLFFTTIISVNGYMAYHAVTSWSGLVVPNTYVASQQFNGKAAEARALAATGVIGLIDVSHAGVRYEVLNPDQGPVAADSLTLSFRRPVGEHQDFKLELTPEATGVFVASREILPGHWIVEASALRDGKRILHQAERISVHAAKSGVRP